MNAIQDRYPEPFAHCYGCGAQNPNGWQIKSYFVDGSYVCTQQVPPEYTGGWSDSMYGGIIASLIDCHASAAAADAKGRELGLPDDATLPRFVTASLAVEYLAPTPMQVELRLSAVATKVDGRKVWISCDVIPDGADSPTARGEVLMIQVRD